MINKLLTFLSLASVLAYSSCDNDDPMEEPPILLENYIQFKADGNFIDCDYKILLQDPVFNAYYVKGESVEMRRLVTDANTEGMNFQIDRFDMENTALPVTITYSTDLSQPTVTAIYTNDQNVSYGSSSDDTKFSITINSYEENLITCNFSGQLFTSGANTQEITLTQGVVNLELIEY